MVAIRQFTAQEGHVDNTEYRKEHQHEDEQNEDRKKEDEERHKRHICSKDIPERSASAFETNDRWYSDHWKESVQE